MADRPATTRRPTRERILEAATVHFGSRGVDAVSLDQIAGDVGVAKQTLLYWFPSKDELVHAVLVSVATELSVVIDAAVRAAPDSALERIDAVVRAVFRSAVRRPALVGLMREFGRLPPPAASQLHVALAPLIERGVAYLSAEMDAGNLRRGDPRVIATLCYATITGVATEPEALRATGWTADAVGLRRLRSELRAFVRAALAPPTAI